MLFLFESPVKSRFLNYKTGSRFDTTQLGWVATDMKIGYIHYQAAEDGGISADYHLMLNQDSNEIAMAYEGHLQMHEHRLITMES